MPQDDAPQLAAAPAAVEYRTPNTFCGVYILRRRTMPQRQRRPTKNTQLGPYDLSTRKLPGGTEIAALAAGYASQALMDSQEAGYPARERAKEHKVGYERGYVEAAGVANGRMIRDTKSAYLLADTNKPHGGILRGMELKQVFDEYGTDISRSLQKALPKTDSTKRKMLEGAMGLQRGQSVTDGLPAQYRFVVKDGLVITHATPAKTYLIAQDRAAMNTYIAGLLGGP